MTHSDTRTAGPSGRSPVRSAERTATHEGGAGYLREPKGELFLLAVANMVGHDTYYERAGERDDRYTALVRQLAVEDPAWTAGLLGWLRGPGRLRTAALVGAAEYVKARLEHGASTAGTPEQPDGAAFANRAVVASVLQRPDEPGELLAYWISRHGRAIPKPVKRGVADAVRRLYRERSMLKYDTESNGFRFGDVLELVHAAPTAPWQGDLFRHAIDRRHRADAEIPGSLGMLAADLELRRRAEGDPAVLLDAGALRAAGMTWETALSLAGPDIDKARLWESLIPSMGYMALLRNLRNFDKAQVSDEVAEQVAARLTDPEQVACSRQFPFRILAAYRAAPSLRWAYPLERALDLALGNVPALPGRTLVLVDRSDSMFGGLSQRTRLNRADAAAVFGTAVASRAERADLVQFGYSPQAVEFGRGKSVLRVLEDFQNLGGTNTTQAVRSHYDGHDRVLIVTDEQAHLSSSGDPTEQVPAEVPLYTWNLAGYRAGHGPSGTANRHVFGGLTDQAFRMVPLLEQGRDGSWPWES